METRSISISPAEILEDPMSFEPESLQSPTTPPGLSSKDKVFWPRDLLPNDFPDVRIFTYGYDSRLASLSSTGARGTWNITQYANDFLVRLNQELEDNVPVIICAHSLGGVITKKVASSLVDPGFY